MPRRKAAIALVPSGIEALIHVFRGQRVMVDADLAKMYGVSTRALNQAVERNPSRFPADFSFLLSQQEFMDLRSQIVISKVGRGGRRYRPRVFTEQGVAMLSSVLRSPMAVRVNIEIMRAFVRIRRLVATPGELVAQLQQLADTVQLHDSQIREIADVIRKMIEPPPYGPKRRVGFHPPEPA